MTPVDFATFVHDLATRSGEAILPFFRSTLGASNKAGPGAPFDPVTEADRAGEAVMRQMIRRVFPAHGIVGEEHGAERADAEYVWHLDPIDGTKAFVTGLPTWGTLIGLTRNGHPAYGMMHQPFTGERFFGDGASSHFIGTIGPREASRRLRARRALSLAEATVMTTSPAFFSENELEAYRRVEAGARLARYGCDCYAYCMVAAGHADLVVEAGLKPHDVVALVPIVEGAGGVITTWDGGAAAAGGRIVASGDPRLHEAALTLLRG